MDEQTIRDAPQRRILQGLLSRTDSMERSLNSPSQHGAAGRRPMAITVTWGPIGLQTARRAGSTGFEFLAPLVSPGVYLTPNFPTTVNPFIAVPGSFIWCSTHVSADLCWTYTYIPKIINNADLGGTTVSGALSAVATTVPTVAATTNFSASGSILINQEQINYTGKAANSFTGCTRGANGTTAVAHASLSRIRQLMIWDLAATDGIPQGNLWDPAIANNGGAIALMNFSGLGKSANAITASSPRISVDIDIVDMTRARSLTGGRTPIETFCAGSYGFKKLPKRTRFQHGTQLEPRLYVNEVAGTAFLNDETAIYTAASFNVWVNMVFKGYTVNPRVYRSMGGP